MKKYIHSRLLRWLLSVGLVILSLMTIARLAFVFVNKPDQILWTDMAEAFFMGLRYDIRVVGILVFCLLVLGSFKMLNPFESKRSKKMMFIIFGIFFFVTTLVYAIDFAHYAYLSSRLNASILNYLQEGKTSIGMVWETYPVIRIGLALIFVMFLLMWTLKKLFIKASIANPVIKKYNRVSWVAATILF